MTQYTDMWLSRPLPALSTPRYRLICFPHAGGAASFFRNWGPNLPAFEVCAVRYPGRAERIDDPQPIDLRQVGRDIAKEIALLTDLPLVLFGHSMGAAVALETARTLEDMNIAITHLFASGSRNRPLPPKEGFTEEDDESLCKHLVEIGGTDSDAVTDPTFLELVLPSIRADGKMFQNYAMDLEPTLKCPVTTIYGDVDHHADTRPWHQIAPEGFNEECVPGDHFYLISEPPYKLISQVTELSTNFKLSVASL